MDLQSGPDLRDRSAYGHWTAVPIRYSDQDAMAHVNNVALAQYVEASRTAFIYELVRRGGVVGLEFILARMAIDYVAEVHYPGVVDVGARLQRLGTKSLTTAYGLFVGDQCVALSECVNVFYDMSTRKTVAPPDEVRAALQAEMTA